jgi:hypothetical protein
MPLTGLNGNIRETLTRWQILPQMHWTRTMNGRLFIPFRELCVVSPRISTQMAFTNEGLIKENTRNPTGRGFQDSLTSLGYHQEPTSALCPLQLSPSPQIQRDSEDGSHFLLLSSSILLSSRKRATLHQVSDHKTFFKSTTTEITILFNIPFRALEVQQ